jgi:hypothetical protein
MFIIISITVWKSVLVCVENFWFKSSFRFVYSFVKPRYILNIFYIQIVRGDIRYVYRYNLIGLF